jgi:hypothetical protein
MRRSAASLGIGFLLTTGASLALLLVNPAAWAGTYSVLACSLAPGGGNHSWVAFDSDPEHLSSGQTCPPTPGPGEGVKSTGMWATDKLGSSSNAPDGSTAGAEFTAVPGTAIVGFQDDRYIGAYADNSWTPSVKADNTVLETCTFTFPQDNCGEGNPFNMLSLNALIPVNGASTLSVAIQCNAPIGCSEGATLHSAWAALYGARVVLSEQAPPSIADPTGPLWTDATHRLTEQVSFHASDLTGISQAALSVDGVAMAHTPGICDYTRPLPCQPLIPTFDVDTTQLPDGTHTLTLSATNAAGNHTSVSEPIVVANQPPPPPAVITPSTTPAVVAPAPSSPLKPKTLKISHKLESKRLIVVIHLPDGSNSTVSVTLDAYQGHHRFAHLKRRVTAHNGIATLTFRLSHRSRHATVLDIEAQASAAGAATLAVHPPSSASHH